MIIVPVLLIKNEELWIRYILSALAQVFPHIIVCDTGSTDSTVDEVMGINHLYLYDSPILLIQNPTQSPKELTGCRQFMQDMARRRLSATHIFLVDGDELYPVKYLRAIANNPMPESSLSGFTSGIECCEKENGELWFYGRRGVPVGLNRQAIIPVTSTWKGVYPFESPDCYIPGSPLNHYFPAPEGMQGFYHVHHTRRSRHDGAVYLRSQKRNQFSMQDAPPDILPERLWLKRREDYIDE